MGDTDSNSIFKLLNPSSGVESKKESLQQSIVRFLINLLSSQVLSPFFKFLRDGSVLPKRYQALLVAVCELKNVAGDDEKAFQEMSELMLDLVKNVIYKFDNFVDEAGLTLEELASFQAFTEYCFDKVFSSENGVQLEKIDWFAARLNFANQKVADDGIYLIFSICNAVMDFQTLLLSGRTHKNSAAVYQDVYQFCQKLLIPCTNINLQIAKDELSVNNSFNTPVYRTLENLQPDRIGIKMVLVAVWMYLQGIKFNWNLEFQKVLEMCNLLEKANSIYDDIAHVLAQVRTEKPIENVNFIRSLPGFREDLDLEGMKKLCRQALGQARQLQNEALEQLDRLQMDENLRSLILGMLAGFYRPYVEAEFRGGWKLTGSC